ncbi:2-polyprenyl-3-methyl-6-methoxy-1,4-benzoquinone monooxygenase [Cellvibrio sp. UBA7661]|uniref:2-polyprenyl-3-methyl-6-methoxy-1,4-benzoquinone monooxygenase n=1 Tax=Cellvibrio sp. UBA7661 TaxID=1946311 RepID=UPI002F356B42
MPSRHLSLIDNLIINADRALRTLAAGSDMTCERPSPATSIHESQLSDVERKKAAALMRVNHTGEVCAQALYQGQALTAKLPNVRTEMEKAADEEIDHLVWCQQRLDALGGHTSYLNPLWYGLSFAIGAGAGLISDKVSLGFVAATEDQVCKHLQSHLTQLPEADVRSRAVVEQMLIDEAQHAEVALDAGGYRFPRPVKGVMTLVSKVMTGTSYHI